MRYFWRCAEASSSAAWSCPRSLSGRPPSIRDSSSSFAAPSTTRTSARLSVSGNDIVGIGVCGHLGQVSDTEELATGAESGQLLAHCQRGGAPDTGIDLVERKHRGIADTRGQAQRERQPAQLTTRGDLRSRCRGEAGVGRKEKLNPISSFRPELAI